MASRRAKPRQDAGDQRIREAAAEIYRVVRPVTLDEITVLGEVQVRVNGLDEQRVEQYVEFLLAGGSFKDPIDLFEAGERLILGAGWHRREAYKRALERFVPSTDVPELASLKAEIHPGGLPAAIEWAEEDNLAHGLELSPRDKRNILERRMKRGHEWAKLSNRALAAKLGVHHDTVAAWRREIEDQLTGGNPPVARVGADGREYDVSNIQVANQLRAAREAFHGLNLPVPEVGTPDFEQINALRPKLIASVGYIKTLFEPGARLRPWLPWALSIELDADEPRLTLINWLRGELPKWKEEQEAEQREKGKTEQANDRMVAKLYELPEAALSDNRYQMEDEPVEDWLKRSARREQKALVGDIDEALQRGEPVADEDLAEKLSTLLRVGDMVAGHLEMVLERSDPLPEWLLVKLNELQGLLYGRAGRDADIYDPGLTQLLDDLYAKHLREIKEGQS